MIQKDSNQNEVYRIHAYDLLTFVEEVIKGANLGFTVDANNIENYPQQLGYQFVMGMKKKEQAQDVEAPQVSQVLQSQQDEQQGQQQQVQQVQGKRGPKPKN